MVLITVHESEFSFPLRVLLGQCEPPSLPTPPMGGGDNFARFKNQNMLLEPGANAVGLELNILKLLIVRW